ncbi:hypothetical protein MHU86_19720 [Fragilaria crotonensis]|nr:hypothetical protein MHU86_19720 [Fragilaria crotonensis]
MQLTTTATNGSVLPPVRTGRRITNITLPFARTESPHGIGTFRTQRQPDVKELDSRLSSRRQPAGLPTGLRGRGTPASTRGLPPGGVSSPLLLSLPASSLRASRRGRPGGTVTGSTRGPSSLHNFLLCSRERSVKMVPEGRVPPPGHKPEFLPIRTGNRRAVSDNSAIPADGHTWPSFTAMPWNLVLPSGLTPTPPLTVGRTTPSIGETGLKPEFPSVSHNGVHLREATTGISPSQRRDPEDAVRNTRIRCVRNFAVNRGGGRLLRSTLVPSANIEPTSADLALGAPPPTLEAPDTETSAAPATQGGHRAHQSS